MFTIYPLVIRISLAHPQYHWYNSRRFNLSLVFRVFARLRQPTQESMPMIINVISLVEIAKQKHTTWWLILLRIRGLYPQLQVH